MPFSPANTFSAVRRDPGAGLVALGLVVALALTPAIFLPFLYDDFTLAKQASLIAASALVLAGLAWRGELLPRDRLVRLLVMAWIAALAISFLVALDRRGSILGYYQYRQGLLTQTAYIALFLGSLSLHRGSERRWFGVAGMLGLAAVVLYTAVQAVGQDPIEWWLDTSDRAIGTIGNANELAAYAVVALSLGGLVRFESRRASMAALVAVAACVSFVIFESESRSGLLALATAFVAYPVAALVLRQDARAWTPQWGLVFAGFIVGLGLSLLAGGAAGTASRVQAGITQQETSGSTRFELWKGTIEVIKAAPLNGSGPDGLYLAFPQHRPADLGGAFLDYDLVAQSSHNALLDVAANQGLLGLGALVGLLGVVAARSIRHERGTTDGESTALIWAAMTGYVALTMVNPVSLAAHALFFLLAGRLAGRAEDGLPAPAKRQSFAPAFRLALVSPAAGALLGIALLMPVADYRAEQAWGHFARGEFGAAAEKYGHAAGLLPFQRTYAAAEADAWLAAGVEGGDEPLRRARQAFEQFDRDFGFGSGEAIGLATAQIGLRETRQTKALISRALDLNPHGVSMADYTATLNRAVEVGGELRYSEKDRWVYVVPAGSSE